MSHPPPCSIRFSAAENTVCIELAHFNASDVLRVLEAICAAIAAADPQGNPLGLFCHPLTGAETTMVFAGDAMQHQDAIALLIEQMYVACNNPAHIRVESDTARPVTQALVRQVQQHLKTPSVGGYVAEDRPKATWVWQLAEDPKQQPDVMASYQAAGGDLQLVPL